jgi:hypothetical protein
MQAQRALLEASASLAAAEERASALKRRCDKQQAQMRVLVDELSHMRGTRDATASPSAPSGAAAEDASRRTARRDHAAAAAVEAVATVASKGAEEQLRLQSKLHEMEVCATYCGTCAGLSMFVPYYATPVGVKATVRLGGGGH